MPSHRRPLAEAGRGLAPARFRGGDLWGAGDLDRARAPGGYAEIPIVEKNQQSDFEICGNFLIPRDPTKRLLSEPRARGFQKEIDKKNRARRKN